MFEVAGHSILFKFPSKALHAIMEEEHREIAKKYLAVEKFLEGCSKQTLSSLDRQAVFEELAWNSRVCRQGETLNRVCVIYKGSLAVVDVRTHCISGKGGPLEAKRKFKNSKIVKVLGPELCVGLLETRYGRPLKYEIQANESETIVFWLDAALLWDIAKNEQALERSLKFKGLQFSLILKRTGLEISKQDVKIKTEKPIFKSQAISDQPIDSLENDKKNQDQNENNSKPEGYNINGRGLLKLDDLFCLRRKAIESKCMVSETDRDIIGRESRYNLVNLRWYQNLARR